MPRRNVDDGGLDEVRTDDAPSGRLRLFQDEKASWTLTAFVLGFVSLMKGLQAPSYWAATQGQVDYSLGFVKRGLFGAALGRPLELWHYGRFAVVSFALLGTLMLLYVAFVRKSGLYAQPAGRVTIAIFAASYVATFFSSLNGYLDIPLACLTLAVLLVRDLRLRVALTMPVLCVALLVHEMFLFVFLPVILLSFLLQGARERKRFAYVSMGAILVVSLAITCAVALRAPMGAVKAKALEQMIQSRVDFVPQQEVFDVLVRSAKDNAVMMLGHMAEFQWWAKQIICAVAFGPTTFVLLYVIRRAGSAVHELFRMGPGAVAGSGGFDDVPGALCGCHARSAGRVSGDAEVEPGRCGGHRAKHGDGRPFDGRPYKVVSGIFEPIFFFTIATKCRRRNDLTDLRAADAP